MGVSEGIMTSSECIRGQGKSITISLLDLAVPHSPGVARREFFMEISPGVWPALLQPCILTWLEIILTEKIQVPLDCQPHDLEVCNSFVI